MRRCYCTGNPPSPSGFPITKLLSRCGCRCCRHKHSATFLSLRPARFSGRFLSLVACFQAFYTPSSLRSSRLYSTVAPFSLVSPDSSLSPSFRREFLRDVSSVLPTFVRLPLASLLVLENSTVGAFRVLIHARGWLGKSCERQFEENCRERADGSLRNA